MTWNGLKVLDYNQQCTDKAVDKTYNVDICCIRRAGKKGTCFGCKGELKPAETVYKVHKEIKSPPKNNICLCQTCFTAGYDAVV